MLREILFKKSWWNGELDNYDSSQYVRTDFILENLYVFLLENHYHFQTKLNAVNQKERNVLETMKKYLKIFRDIYRSEMRSFVETLNVMHENCIDSALLKTANILFEDGITWYRIIAYFSVVNELGIWCFSKKLPDTFINFLYERFSCVVKEKLLHWIEDHDGWEGILKIDMREKNAEEEILKSNWMRSALYTTIKMLGVLATIGNTVNNYDNVI